VQCSNFSVWCVVAGYFSHGALHHDNVPVFSIQGKGLVYCNVVDTGFLLRIGFGLAAALRGLTTAASTAPAAVDALIAQKCAQQFLDGIFVFASRHGGSRQKMRWRIRSGFATALKV
jgi:hypothetical protein